MILRLQQRSYFLAFIFVFVLNITHAKADVTSACHVTIINTKFDLTTLAGEHVVNRTRETPPTTMVDSLRFNVCADLKPQDGLPKQDQCPTGTRACLTKINKRVNEGDRIITVIPIAQTSILEPKYFTSLPPNFISLLLHGPAYSSPFTSLFNPQSLNLTVLCNPEETSDPKFISYDGSRLVVEWSSPAGCPSKDEDGHKDDDKKDDKKEDDKKSPDHKSVGSGLGWFFPAIFLCLITYFGLGAYYNYSTYGARGADLIPWVLTIISATFLSYSRCLPRHRDFWKEVPYMLSDVVSHLCSNIRPRTSSRGGYISV